MKKAFITGISGQDGSYLAELLLEKGYEVHGMIRRSSLETRTRIDHLYQDPHTAGRRFFLHFGDMTDSSCILYLMEKIRPDEIYNLAAQSHVRVSFETPEYTANVDAIGALRILEAMRTLKMNNTARFYQASSSELFGKAQTIPQNELTPFYPRSPYAASKVYSYWATVNYREAYGMFATNGILFNHESPRRGDSFVTKKIAQNVAMIQQQKLETMYLGNLDAKRDWGFAPDFVEAMWRMLQYDRPEDFVIATGETHTVREFVEKSFQYIDIQIRWEGEGVNESGIDSKSGKTLVKIDPWYFRPTEVDILLGDFSKAKRLLNWEPTVRFEELIGILVNDALSQKGHN
ncbi:MAG: GDP-mannose 4,6-dehydratase [Bacteroidales bacterium]|nr:GDP-mannose 4,6-dehydratase [Bacteroidales bacterium]